MKTDFYTKTILTIIAVCLVVIVARGLDIIPNAKAAETELRGQEQALNLYDLRPNSDGSINVRVISVQAPSDGYPVKIKSYEAYNDLPVSIKSASGTVPVEVRNYRDFR